VTSRADFLHHPAVGGTGKTTIDRPSTTRGRDRERSLALRWLFPILDGRLTVLRGPRTVLGRDEAADVVLAGSQASRRHAEITVEGLATRIRDLDSRNGVFLNGKRVQEGFLSPGAIIRIGEWIGVVVVVDGAAEEDSEPFRAVLPGYFAGPITRAALDPVARAAPSDLPVIIEGETGAGKEGVARAVHAWSGRTGAFLAVNCSALPEALAEGELFGYRRGAFTGADRANAGYLRAAHEGTLFLDEIADLPATLQPKLLRALEQREVIPLGETRPVTTNVRIVAATQAPLKEAVDAKRFRADLYARLEGLTVHLPPLRARVEEIPFLFMTMLAQSASGGRVPEIDAALIERLCLYDWPFNVRELQLLAKQLMALHGGEALIGRSMLPSRLLEHDRPRSPVATPAAGTVVNAGALRAGEPLDSDGFIAVLRSHGGNVARAAAALGISRQRAYRLMGAAPDFDVEAIRRPIPSADKTPGN
jgi:transcriptional regulator with AAA-type ATPase domain